MAAKKAASGGTENRIDEGKGSNDKTAEPQAESAGSPRKRDRAKQRQDPGEGDSQPARTPTNSIRPSRPRARSKLDEPSSEERERATPSQRPKRAARETARSSQSSEHDADSWAIPESVKDRFTQDGRKYYFPDGSPAFRDHGRRLTTPSENTEVIASLIAIAKVREWESITVRGTERFRQEAWKQGKLAGLEVRGYRPDASERAAVIRSLTRQNEESRAAPPSTNDRTTTAEVPDPTNDRPTRSREEPIVGKLLDHGKEHYQFDPKEDLSYFVRLQTPHGKRIIWGADFERALNHSLSQPQIGDEVVLQKRGTDTVKVTRRERDGAGKVIHETPVDTHRNSWSIERRQFLDERARAAATLRDPSVTPKRAVLDHPELAGTLLQLRAAEIAAQRIRNAEDRAEFVNTIRNVLADKVARGDPLQPVTLRDREATRTLPEREQTPTL